MAESRPVRRIYDVDALRRVLAEDLGVDLHSHTRHSDGDWTPRDLVGDAERQGIRLLAVTDHDVVSGLDEAMVAGGLAGVVVLPGCEVTTRVGDRVYHVLCYDLDPHAETWRRLAQHRRRARFEFYEAAFAMLGERGYPLRLEDALDALGELVPHPLQQALVAGGHAAHHAAARDLLRRLDLALPTHLLAISAEQFGSLLGPDGGLCSVAHPGRNERHVSARLTPEDAAYLKETLPLVALEAYHPYHSAADVAAYRDLAARLGLQVTCGSDAHGWRVNRPPRAHPAATCRGFLELVLPRWEARTPVYVV